MPQIRANLSVELHRELKGEAVRKDMHLKELIESILKAHVVKNGMTMATDGHKKQEVRAYSTDGHKRMEMRA